MSVIVNNKSNNGFQPRSTADNPGVRNKNLAFVDNLDDYKVHHDDVDIRGYTVKLTTGESVGEVEGLLADVNAKTVRYAEIEVDDDFVSSNTTGTYSDDDRNILLPIGLITIDKDDRSVTVNGIGFEHMVGYPRFNRNNGYTTTYELDTNHYLADFHEYGTKFDRNMFGYDRYSQRDTFDDTFYASSFYTGRR